MALQVGELFAKLGLDSREFEKGVDQSGGKWDKFGSGLAKKGAAATLAAGAAITGLAVKGVMEFGKLERGMNEVFTLMPDITEGAMADMTGQVRDFSKEFGTLPDEVVPALYQAISAGVPKDNVFDFLETAQKAAVGGVTELSTAVDGISSVVNSYGADVMDASRASDLMFTAVKLGKTDFDQLSKSLFNVLPTASALGVGFEDITAAMAAMTAQGTPTSVATTQMRQLLVELSKEGTKTAQTFEEAAGKSFRQFIEEGGNVEGALQLMATEAAKSGSSISDMFGSVEAGSAALALTSESGAAAFSNALGEMDASAGATEKAYDRMDQGVSRNFEKMKARAHDLMLEMGEELAPSVITAGDSLMQLAETALPMVEAGINLVAGAARGFTFIMDGLGDLFGVTDGRAADLARSSQYLNDQMMQGKDPATALANALVDVARTGDLTEEQFQMLARQAGLSDEELAAVKGTLMEYARSGAEAEVTTSELADAFGITESMTSDADTALRNHITTTEEHTGAASDAADAQGELAGETESATSAMRDQHDEMRAQIDPLFRLRDATEDAAEAQQAANDARDEFGEGSAEHKAALADLSEANMDLRAAQINVKDAANLSRDAFINQQTEMGLTRGEAALLADALEELDGFEFKPKTLSVTAKLDTAGVPRGMFGAAGFRRHGGPVTPRKIFGVGEDNKPELFEGQSGLYMIPGERGNIRSFEDIQRLIASAERMVASAGTIARRAAPDSGQMGEGGITIGPGASLIGEVKLLGERLSVQEIQEDLAMQGVV